MCMYMLCSYNWLKCTPFSYWSHVHYLSAEDTPF
jgi:hypothetical protein